MPDDPLISTPKTFLKRMVSQYPQHVHRVRGIDKHGRQGVFVIHVQPSREKAFLEAMGGPVRLEQYGHILARCHGDRLDEETRRFLKETYGLEV